MKKREEGVQTVRAAAVQFMSTPNDKQANLATIRRFVDEAAGQNVGLVAFPEMCLTGYWHLRHLSREALDALAEPVPDGPTTQALLALAQEHHLIIGAGLIEHTLDQTLYNTYVVAMPGGHVARHRKLHCFISAHMASGDTYTVVETSQGYRLGVLTCYDNNIGENVRITALKGADILLAPHQTGGCTSPDPNVMGKISRELWDNRYEAPESIEAEFRGPKGREWLLRWLPARAHDNGVFLVFSNGVGVDDDEIRTGNAMLIDPYGRILAETWKADDDMVIADLDLAQRANSTGQRWIKTRRPTLYTPLTTPTGQEQDTRALRFDKKGV